MLIDTWPHFVANITNISDILHHINWHDPSNWTLLAQNVNIKDADVLGQMQQAFQKFIQSGQAWALAIGLVLGYWFRGLTA